MTNLYGLILISSHNFNSTNQDTWNIKIYNLFVELSINISYFKKKLYKFSRSIQRVQS